MIAITKQFDDEVLERVCAAVQVGDVISTLGISRPNWVTGIREEGILVETCVLDS